MRMKINLVSKEGEKIEVDLEVAKMSYLVVNTLGEDDEDEDEDDKDVYLPNVKTSVLKKVIEYCHHYKNVEEMTKIGTPLPSSKIEDVVQDWYVQFCRVSEKMLFQLVTAANFMDIKPLLDLSCFAVAVLLKGKTDSEIRQIFNMKDKPTAVESREIQLENEWSDKP